MSTRDGTKFASSLPKIGELRAQLGFGGNPSSASSSSPSDRQQTLRTQVFNDTLRIFRSTYVTSAGVPGAELYDWKSRDHQHELARMAEVFLDEQGNGDKFWPLDNHDLCYATHHKIIKRSMIELLFRLNQQQYRNNRYKKRGGSSTIGGDGYGHGHSRTTPIELVDVDSDYHEHDTVTAQHPARTRVNRQLATPAESSRATSHLGQEDAFNRPSTRRIDPPDTIISVRNPASATHSRARGALISEGEYPPAKRRRLESEDIHSDLIDGSSDIGEQEYPENRTDRRAARANRGVRRREGFIPEDDADEYYHRRDSSPEPELERPRRKQPNYGQRRSHQADNAEVLASNVDPQILQPSGSEPQLESGNAPSLNSLPSLPDQIPRETEAQETSSQENSAQINQSVPSASSLNTTSSTSNINTSQPSAPHPPPSNNNTTPNKPQVELVCTVIQSWLSMPTIDIWRPEGGRFMDKTLAQIMQAALPTAPSTDMTGIVFKLRTSDKALRGNVTPHDEPGFVALKKEFTRLIAAALGRTKDRPLMVEMSIEPVYNNKSELEEVEAPIEDVCW